MAKQKTVAVETAVGGTLRVPVGADGKNPVTPENPPAKAVIPDEPKQPKEKGITDAKAPISPDNPAQEKSQGSILSEGHGGVFNPEAVDINPSNPDAPAVTGAGDGLDPKDFEYEQTAVGTVYDEETGTQKVAKADEQQKSDPDPDDPADPEPKAPAKSANKGEWVEYAKSQGATDEDLKDEDGKDLTQEQIIEKYGDA